MENDDENWSKQIDQELDQFINNFKNRKKYSFLTPEILATISDEDIEQAIFDYIHSKILDHEEAHVIVSLMSQGLQMVYSTWVLEGEVNNGGFNQFFYNTNGRFAEMTLRSLMLIEADVFYHIFERALSIHQKEKDNQVLQDLYSQRTLSAFFQTYEMTNLNQCDQAFYSLKGELQNLRIKYIREHPEQFIGN